MPSSPDIALKLWMHVTAGRRRMGATQPWQMRALSRFPAAELACLKAMAMRSSSAPGVPQHPSLHQGERRPLLHPIGGRAPANLSSSRNVYSLPAGMSSLNAACREIQGPFRCLLLTRFRLRDGWVSFTARA